MLPIYDFIYGIAQFAAAVLSIIAGVLAITLFKSSHKEKLLQAWKPLSIALVLFMVEEVIGGLKTFGIIEGFPFLTHIIPSFILGFLIWALLVQIHISRGWKE